ncbi:MAG TPA: SDR family oxidoreductase [Frankiaceae bacterium]|nr:SDR family oxidoreductase [Frankiaceae bacterium]
MSFDFSGKAVLVTGASRGIGRAVAVAFAEAGAHVAVHYNAGAQAAAETLSALPGSGHAAVQADLADAGAVRAMVDGAAADLGGLDVLVNNAGVYVEHRVADVTYEQWQAAWQQTLATNLTGAANAIWCAVPHLRARGGGAIVNVSSRGAFRGEPDHPAYAASKAGLNALGQSLAQALAPHGISVGTVAPGFVETEMVAPILDGPAGGAVREQSPLGRVARPEEVAYAVLFLASPGAAFATGTILDVNGASYLRS